MSEWRTPSYAEWLAVPNFVVWISFIVVDGPRYYGPIPEDDKCS